MLFAADAIDNSRRALRAVSRARYPSQTHTLHPTITALARTSSFNGIEKPQILATLRL